MNTIFLLLCLVSQTPDTLYAVDFSQPNPAGWSFGPNWEFNDDGIFLYLMCNCKQKRSDQDSLISPEFVVPLSADSLVLEFDHYWWGHGGSSYIDDWAKSTSTLGMYRTGQPGLLELWMISDSCGGVMSDSYSLFDSSRVNVPITNISVGDTLTFVFKGMVESYMGHMYAEAWLEWDIYTLSILNYPSVSLEQSTWGMIKASF